MRPPLESVGLEQPQAGFVVTENIAEEGMNSQRGRPRDCDAEEISAESVAPVRGGDVDRDHRRSAISGADVEWVKTQPRANASVPQAEHPDWPPGSLMRIEPR